MTCRKNLNELNKLGKEILPLLDGFVEHCVNALSHVKTACGGKDDDGWFFRCSECGSITRSEKRLLINQKVVCEHCGTDYFFKKTDFRIYWLNDTYLIDFIQEYDGKLLLRRFECHKSADSDLEHSHFYMFEYARIIEGNTYYLKNAVAWLYSSKHKTDKNQYVEFLEYCDYSILKKGKFQKNPLYEPYEGYNMQILEKLGLKYCQYFEYKRYYSENIIDYVNRYRDVPKVELLVKGGYKHLVASARFLNLNGKNFEQIFGIPKYWEKHVKDGSLTIVDIRKIKKYGIKTYGQLIGMRKAKDFGNVPDELINNQRFCEFVYKNPYHLYKDYLDFIQKLGMPFNNKTLYPVDLQKAHDELQHEVTRLTEQRLKKGFDDFLHKLNEFKYQDDMFLIRPAESQNELIKESTALDHCVRTYAERMANHETAIFFLRKQSDADTPLYTIELKNKRVVQARGNHNCPLDEKAAAFVKKWERKFKFTGY